MLFVGLLSLSTATMQAQGVRTVVIDPGHGGKIAPGAVSGTVLEKDLALDVALRLGKLLETSHPNVKIIYTRKTDVALGKSVPEDLKARTTLANNAGADLFVSIHANAATSSAAYGVETLIMGESSLEQQRNEATLYTNHREELLDMSDERTAAIVRAYIQNLQFTYGEYSEALARLIQQGYGKYGRKLRPVRKQPLMVLYGVDMPAVLTEIGFMSNPDELKYMLSSKGKGEIAASIHKGIADYITMVNKTQQAAAKVHSTTTTTTTTTRISSNGGTHTYTAPTSTSSTTTYSSSSSGSPSQSYVMPSSQASASAAPSQSYSTTTHTTTTVHGMRRGYTVQLLAAKGVTDKMDTQFKMYRGHVWYFVSGGGTFKYKYCYGQYATREEAQRELQRARTQFRDAFVVEFNFDR